MSERGAFFLAVVCAGACSSSGGDGGFCGAVGCTDAAMVRLHTTSGTWAAGTYQINMTVDGTASTCTFLTPGTSPDSMQVVCSPAVRAYFICHKMGLDAGCSSIPPLVDLELDIPGTPPNVMLSASRDGNPIGGATIAPKYAVSQPNGPNCEPTCHVASSDLSVGD